MPESCIYKPCRECSFSVVKDGKLLCNYQNRLGLAKSDVTAYIGGESDEEVLKRKAEAKLKEYEEVKALLERVKKVSEG